MKVLVVSSAFPPFPSPESTHTMFLCERLAQAGLDVHLVTSCREGISAPASFSVYPAMVDWRWRRLPRLLSLIRRLRPDRILLVHLGWIYDFEPMVSFLPTLCRLLGPSSRFVTQFENIQLGETRWSRRIAKLLRFLPTSTRVDPHLGTLLSASDRIICLSERHIDVIEELHPGVRLKSTMIPAPPLLNVLDDADGSLRARGRQQIGVSENERLLAFFGFVYPSKGIETLLQALAGIWRRERLKLVVIGAISDPSYGGMLKELERTLELEGCVIWHGHCDPAGPEASTLLRAADCAVFPFDIGVRLNNSSVAVAAAHGLPIITTQGDDIERAFAHGANVWLCPAMDPTALSAGIERVCADARLRDHLQRGALELVRDCFSWEYTIAETIRMLQCA